MNERKKEFIAFLVESQALQFGEFTLKSGDKSPFFVDLGCVRTGKALQFLGRALAQGLKERFPAATLLFGPAYKGIALATAAAVGCWSELGKDLPVCYNRKESKGHGEKGLFIGQAPTPEDRVVIIDDVLSSGGTKLDAAKALEACARGHPRPRRVPRGEQGPEGGAGAAVLGGQAMSPSPRPPRRSAPGMEPGFCSLLLHGGCVGGIVLSSTWSKAAHRHHPRSKATGRAGGGAER